MTPDQTNEIKAALDRINTRSASYTRFYNYYAGRHTWNFSSQKFKNKYGQRLQELKENLCRTVVKAPASRLEIVSFLAEKEDIQKRAWEIWKRGNMPLHSGSVHREAFKTGDAYVIVWPGIDAKARLHAQAAGNVTVWKNGDTGEIEKAAKRWVGSDKRSYMTIYYPDRIEKYVSKEIQQGQTQTEDFIPRTVPGESFPLANPYGRVPVFHFAFENELEDFGTSLLTDVIPLNDALNKSYADIFVGQEYNSMRQRYVAGLRVEQDEETGKKIEPFKPDDATWIAEDSETKFGEFTDASLQQMLMVKQETVRDIALVSGIPPSYFNLEQTGTAISGEALRKIEARFTAIIQDAQRSFGETWGKAIAFALEIEGGAAGGSTETQWTDAAPVSETEQLDNALKKKNLGWSLEQIQRDFGLTDKQIADMSAENSARAEADMQTKAKFFDAGTPIA